MFTALLLATIIHSTTDASASTGGNSTDGGGVVVTGSADASSEVTSNVNGGSGTVTVEASATANGQTEYHSETIVIGDEPVEVNVEASASSGEGAHIESSVSENGSSLVPASKNAVKVKSASEEDGVIEEFEVAATSSVDEPQGLIELVVDTVVNLATFFGKVFGWFGA